MTFKKNLKENGEMRKNQYIIILDVSISSYSASDIQICTITKIFFLPAGVR